jgi:hypothetical protein
MTAAKFKPLIFSVSGLALSNVTNIFFFMILDDLYLQSFLLFSLHQLKKVLITDRLQVIYSLYNRREERNG